MLRGFMAALLVAIGATATAGELITFEEAGLGRPNTFKGMLVSVKGARFSGGSLFGQGNLVYGSIHDCSGCGDIVVTLPPGSTDVSFDVRGYGTGFPSFSRLPVIVTDGETVQEFSGYSDWSVAAIPVSSGRITVRVTSATFGYSLAIDNLRYTVPVPTRPLSVELELTTDPAHPVRFGKDAAGGGTVRAKIALGTFFTVRLTTRAGVLEPVREVPLAETIVSENVSPVPSVFGTHLYKTKNLLPLNPGSERPPRFLALHLGEARLRLLPLEQGFATPDLIVEVVPPAALGSRENSWDELLTKVAHERGIPPQYLKGQAEQESPNGREFVRAAWRYEPCAGDAVTITGGRLFDRAPYSLYKLDDDIGGTLPDRTLALRNVLSIPTAFDANGFPAERRRITGADRGVKASDIFKANDLWPQPDGTRGMGWFRVGCGVINSWLRRNVPRDQTPTRKDVLEAADAVLNFTAQTHLAASYGLFQVMYSTAMQVRWKTTDAETGEVDQDPYLLLDTEENHRIPGGGSFAVGSAYDARNFGDDLPRLFTDRATYEERLRVMFQAYNPRKPDYGRDVMARSRSYVPSQPTLVFE